MKVEIKINPLYEEPEILILTAAVTEEIQKLVSQLSKNQSRILAGWKDEKLEIIDEKSVNRIFAVNKKVVAATDTGEYLLHLRLYELEEQLDPHQFIRISNSEIIHLKKVKNFDLSLSGTICVQLKDGSKTYVSRRYVSKIKEMLGV